MQTLKQYHKDGGVSGGVSGGVNAVLEFIRNHPGYRTNAIAEALHIPLRTIERYLRELKKQGRIEFCGAPRNGGYFELKPQVK